MTTPPLSNQAPKRRRPIALALVALGLIMVLAASCRVRQDYYGVWTMTGPGLSITVLPDIRIGPVLWLYLGGEFRGRWQEGEWQSPAYPPATPYPTSTPYPTATPYPAPAWKMPLKQV